MIDVRQEGGAWSDDAVRADAERLLAHLATKQDNAVETELSIVLCDDAFILGEVWTDARAWLQGDEMDSVTNYRWRGAVLDFFASDRSSPAQFASALESIRSDYPAAASAVSLGSTSAACSNPSQSRTA